MKDKSLEVEIAGELSTFEDYDRFQRFYINEQDIESAIDSEKVRIREEMKKGMDMKWIMAIGVLVLVVAIAIVIVSRVNFSSWGGSSAPSHPAENIQAATLFAPLGCFAFLKRFKRKDKVEEKPVEKTEEVKKDDVDAGGRGNCGDRASGDGPAGTEPGAT